MPQTDDLMRIVIHEPDASAAMTAFLTAVDAIAARDPAFEERVNQNRFEIIRSARCFVLPAGDAALIVQELTAAKHKFDLRPNVESTPSHEHRQTVKARFASRL